MVTTNVNKFSALSQSIASVGIATGLAVGVSLSIQSNAHALSGFQGAYAPANWTFTNSNADGSVNTSSAPNSITLTGGNNGSGSSGTTDYTIAAVSNSTIAFNWNYSTVDGPSWDPFNFLLNGTPTQLTNSGGAQTQSGLASFNVNTGDIFGFRISTVDNVFGPGVVTISNFPDATAVPFDVSPTTGLLMLGGIYGFNHIRNSRKLKGFSK
ncbi:hypothetical protein Sta7437_1674 [Stanieria cyanosphaera PCC 7437]|uniref:Uncharacterized protein n=1 Tax=Stanieria cyanosphaera (strain ATCC 29371 / PCC 7437) TaxID=111780 RepID=K9XT29_STAC7|nr:hypothetical protein [Stanieria cyanosphaera]AFZ35236.1 hypothetical protein Sta7437_1674 [Stanieria cyanosphaera PCC 7437]